MAEQASTGIAFWILAVVVLVSGLMVDSLRNIFHCAIALILCLSGVAGIYILLHAEFLAAAQVLIYVGAVAVLMVFAIMLTTQMSLKKLIQTNQHATVAFLCCVVFATFAAGLLWKTTSMGIWQPAQVALPEQNVMTIGKLLMTHFMLPFEVISVLLLAAMIGAIVLARKEKS
jgi:NADH-quinone oxidoreductase subunit J